VKIITINTQNFIEISKTLWYNQGILLGLEKEGPLFGEKPFPDEFVDSLKHDGEGVLAMANSGKDTNGSQFYITYKSANHLNGKHTIFGKLVGGSEILREFANFETDDFDRPIEDIVILQTIVYTNPLSDAAIKEAQEVVKEKAKIEKEKGEYGAWLSNPGALPLPKKNLDGTTNSIGKYITNTNLTSKKRSAIDFGHIAGGETKKKKSNPNEYGNFSSF